MPNYTSIGLKIGGNRFYGLMNLNLQFLSQVVIITVGKMNRLHGFMVVSLFNGQNIKQ